MATCGTVGLWKRRELEKSRNRLPHRDGQHQARERGRRRAWRLGPGHVGRAGRRRNRSGTSGEACKGQPHPEGEAARGGATRPVYVPPRLPPRAGMLTQLDQLPALVARCDVRILEVSKPFEPDIQRLQTIVGVGRRSAEVLASEIGVDMSRFSTARSPGFVGAHLSGQLRECR